LMLTSSDREIGPTKATKRARFLDVIGQLLNAKVVLRQS
jgi:hypothetical protein